MNELINICVVTDVTGYQAIYVNDVIAGSDYSISAGDIEKAADGRTILLRIAKVKLVQGAGWPKTLTECAKYIQHEN